MAGRTAERRHGHLPACVASKLNNPSLSKIDPDIDAGASDPASHNTWCDYDLGQMGRFVRRNAIEYDRAPASNQTLAGKPFAPPTLTKGLYAFGDDGGPNPQWTWQTSGAVPYGGIGT